MAAKPKVDDFDAMGAIKRIEEANEGVNFENKVQEAIRRSTDVQTEVKKIVWCLFKEKIAWIILGAFMFVILDLVKMFVSKLIENI